MWSEKEIDDYLKKNLKENRYRHTYGVVKAAESLSDFYHCNREKARLAALLHDCAKYLSEEEIFNILDKKNISIDYVIKNAPQIMHGECSAYIAENLMGVDDKEVLQAIRYHTTGKEDMSLLDKIIYLADCIEENRYFDGIDELRKISFENLDQAVIKGFQQTIEYVIQRGEILHLDTIRAMNYLIIKNR